MNNSLKNAVDKQLSIAKLEEKLHITIGEIDTPEDKLETILKAIHAMNARLMFKALLNLAMPIELVIETLKKEDASEEDTDRAKEAMAFHAGGSIVKDIIESLTFITDIFDKQQDND